MSAPSGGRAGELARFLEIQNLGLNLFFAIAFLLVAAGGIPSLRVLVLAVVAFIAARNAGHSFNRWVDRDLDRQNPRTAGRALVTGRLSERFSLAMTAANAAILVAAAALLNPLALALAPVALALLLGYSATKRWGWGTTLFLGLVEAVTPAAAFVAVQGALPSVAVLAIVGMFFWGSAFETVHSLGDLTSDRALGLPSLPVRVGEARARSAVALFHGAALAAWAGFGWFAGLSGPYFLGLGVVAALVAASDVGFLRGAMPTAGRFRRHMAYGAIFLAGTAVAIFLPAVLALP